MANKRLSFWVTVLSSLLSTVAFADDYGQNWQMGFYESATEIMEKTAFFHNKILLPITVFISLFVLGLMIWLFVRYRENVNPVPSETTHNTPLEVAWTIIPLLMLAIISIFSVKLLTFQSQEPPADVTIKTIGYQWYWGYEYPQIGIEEYSAYMLCPVVDGGQNGYSKQCVDKLRQENKPHKLATDYPMVVPVGKNIRVLITAADVIHAWTIPAFGVKRDAVPGRMNSLWFNAKKEGTYYGQCSELCGASHAFMPITVEVVPVGVFNQWTELMKSDQADAANALIDAYKQRRGEINIVSSH